MKTFHYVIKDEIGIHARPTDVKDISNRLAGNLLGRQKMYWYKIFQIWLLLVGDISVIQHGQTKYWQENAYEKNA